MVTRRKGESKDSIFRKFTRDFIEEDIVTDVRKKQFYKKPSLLRKEEEKERLKNRGKRRLIKRTGFRKFSQHKT